MAKLKCNCGNIISTSDSPNESEGAVLSRVKADGFLDVLAGLVDAMTTAVRANTLDDWRSRNLGSGYPAEVSPGEMIRDIMYGNLLRDALDALECKECGRLWIQAPQTNRYRAYHPEANWSPNDRVMIAPV